MILNKDISRNHGSGLLIKHNNSPSQIFAAVYPDYEWLPWRFNSISDSYWENITCQKQFVNRISKKLKVLTMDDWYNVSPTVCNVNVCFKIKDVIDLGGGFLIAKHGSLSKLLSRVYSEHSWSLSRFKQGQQDIWKEETLAKYFAEKLKTSDDKEVKYLSRSIVNMGQEEDPLVNILSQEFPEYKWGPKTDKITSKKSQFLLKECLKVLFGNDGNKI